MAVGNKTITVAKYILLPQFLPRIAALFFSGFYYFAFFMAQIYRSARLLPASHPYLNAGEIGNYSVPDVISAAARHLVFKRQNIDQIIIFFVILLGLVLMILQALLMLMSVFAPKAMALSLSYYFGDQIQAAMGGFDPSQDLAFILLDRVFGIPGIFNSCVSTAVTCFRSAADGAFEAGNAIYKPGAFPWSYHLGLHTMFDFYSTGLLIIGMIILMYFVIVIIAETAQTGTPFGKRFNKLWAPIRLVVALGLLIPISSGLNSAQYIVLYAAKYGSNFATNGWLLFNSELSNGVPTGMDELIAKPQTPDARELLQFMMLAHACKAVEEGGIIPPNNDKWVKDTNCSIDEKDQKDTYVDAYLVTSTGDPSTDSLQLSQTTYNDAITFFEDSDIIVRFGDRGCTALHNAYTGHVVPTCGELTMSNSTISPNNVGAYYIQNGYYELIKYLWGDYSDGAGGALPLKWGAGTFSTSADFCVYGTNKSTVYSAIEGGQRDLDLWNKSLYYAQKNFCPALKSSNNNALPSTLTLDAPEVDWLSATAQAYRRGDGATVYPNAVSLSGTSPGINAVVLEQIIREGLDAERQSIYAGSYQIPIDLLSRGWGGAGMWYNRIAQGNGIIGAAAWELPKVAKYPKLMNDIMAAKTRNMANVSLNDMMSSSKASDTSLQTNRTGDSVAVTSMGSLYADWAKVEDADKKRTGNTFVDVINIVFGANGLFDMADPANQNVHPLALLTALGKGLIEASIRNVIVGMGGQFGQIISSISPKAKGFSEALGAASGLAYNAATMTLVAGFVLYYVMPFLPFVYFFFALGNWIKGIFEAMVGVPLWALAHIRIDGDGLPGSAALSGYFMIFEIFLRPILIVFGLIASVVIFAAMASTFNAIFPLAVTNLGGLNYDMSGNASWLETARGPIDQLFYSVLYAAVMYIMGMASFKLIDQIPGSTMRWMGSSVSAFGGGDDASQLVSTVGTGGSQITQQLIGGARSFGSDASKVVAAGGSV